MQPYQEAAEVTRHSGEGSLNALKYAGYGALTHLGSKAAGSIISRIGPLLSDYIPESLAIKGLNKVDPRFGKFINKMESEGVDFNEVKDFLGSKIEKTAQENQQAQKLNIIEQESPELFQFLNEEINKGRTPIQAAALARSATDKFNKVIKKLETSHKTPWSSIIETVFGNAGMANQAQQPTQEQQQTGAGADKLLSVLQKLQQSRGA